MAWFAHSSPDGNEPLDDHLAEVGELAAGFAAPFNSSDWARAAGLLHDVGKAREAFLRRLGGDPAKVDHASAGGVAALDRLGPAGRLLAYAVLGHHGGLPDAGKLDERLLLAATHDYDRGAVPELPRLLKPPVDMSGQGSAAFLRMVYSCLVDADFIATERFYDPAAKDRRTIPFHADVLLGRLHVHLDQVSADAEPSQVNDLRRAILARCLAMADQPAGVFSLSVPTGGGKTLASMAFALAHAKHWQKRRVISVIPYTSIIEQNAAVYRDALGAEMVLEHHSNFRHPDDRDDIEAEDAQKLRLAEENWDAPVVVTTSVQFFESLYSNRPSRCRKLHNMAGAVILLDEVQLLPLPFLGPCLETLKLLVKDYGCTVVLCTATQPALADRELFTLIRDLPGAVHLSAAMTPVHRAQILDGIRQRGGVD